MELETDIDRIAEENDLIRIPTNVGEAVTGFDTWDECRAVADRYGMKPYIFRRRANEDTYKSLGLAIGAMKRNPSEFSALRMFTRKDSLTFFSNEVLGFLSEHASSFKNTGEIRDFLDEMDEIQEVLDNLEDDEMLVTDMHGFVEAVQKYTMGYSKDRTHYVIGCVKH